MPSMLTWMWPVSGVTFCVVWDTMRAPVSVTFTCNVEPWITSLGVGETMMRWPVDVSLVNDALGVGVSELDTFGDPPPHAASAAMNPITGITAMRFMLLSSLSDRLLEIAPQQLSGLRLRPHVEAIGAGR